MKKLLLVLCFLSTVFVHSADSKQPLTPMPAQDISAPQEAPSTAEPVKPALQIPAPLPSSEEMTTSYESAFVRMLVTLLGILFLVFATFWILRRLGGGKFKLGSSRTINVVEKRSLSPKSMLYIVEIGNKKILISESQAEVRALTTFDEISDLET